MSFIKDSPFLFVVVVGGSLAAHSGLDNSRGRNTGAFPTVYHSQRKNMGAKAGKNTKGLEKKADFQRVSVDIGQAGMIE